MRLKAIAIGLLSAILGPFLLVCGLDYHPIIWEAVIIGAVAILAGPFLVWVAWGDLTRKRQGTVSEGADLLSDMFK